MSLDDLNKLNDQFKRDKYPNVPSYAIPKSKAVANTANELTNSIIKHIKLIGGWATRINSMGRVLNGKYIPGTTERGTPDIMGVIKGKFISVEIKIKDKQSSYQIEIEKKIKYAGGHYFVCHNFDEWMKYYNTI